MDKINQNGEVPIERHRKRKGAGAAAKRPQEGYDIG